MNMIKICRYFGINGDVLEIKKLNTGHINGTYKVSVEENGKVDLYIVQRINKYVFNDPKALMNNVISVTEFIKGKYRAASLDYNRKVLEFLTSESGEGCYEDEEENFYRAYRFVDNSKTYDLPDSNKLLENIGYALGNFHYLLSDLNAEILNETIPNFHNTRKRLDDLFEAEKQDPFGRAVKVREDLEAFKEVYSLAVSLGDMGLPLRTVHNDPKCNNVLFDSDTDETLAMIDLDTVMPGLAAHDFGDAVRSACNSCNEDEKDYSRVALDLVKFKCFTKGYLSKAGEFLTKEEKESLALGVFTLAVELSSRFLADYILGDKYFAKDYGMHNLVRARSQFALAKDILNKLPEMNEIIKEIC